MLMSEFATDCRSTPHLFELALDSDDDLAWEAISALHWRGSQEVLDYALEFSRSDSSDERMAGAYVLGQLGVPVRTFPEACFQALLGLLEDQDNQVVRAAIMSVRHLDADRAAPHILPFGRHQDSEIRFAVAFALCGVKNGDAIAMLVTLTNDSDAAVRDWATFGLGSQSNVDSEEVRAALVERSRDDDDDVRYEAVIGLGRRCDRRALAFLQTILESDPDDVAARDAAATLLGLNGHEETLAAELLARLRQF